MDQKSNCLRLKWLGIDTYKETVIYMREDCHICRSEGFETQARIQVSLGDRSILATLNIIKSDLLEENEAGLSIYAWELLSAKEGDLICLAHIAPIDSSRFIRSKIYGHKLNREEMKNIVEDVVAGRLTDILISAFLTASAGGRLSEVEILDLTHSMIEVGQKLQWSSDFVVDKHCVGGLPGNRTSLIVVPIVAAFGLMIPKTSSRAITSPSGTADTMEVFAPVNLDLNAMHDVVEKENGCIVWGGGVNLSPSDDALIRIERIIDLDSEGQLVASVLSKKIAAGSTHIIIDIPIGSTAKVRTEKMADLLKTFLEKIGRQLGVTVKTVFTDGQQPVGKGIGPALEAKDVLSVLQCQHDAPKDLRERALMLAGHVLEFSANVTANTGEKLAETILDSGRAWKKFQAICEAQGGLFEPPQAMYTKIIFAETAGKVTAIDNRRLARIAKLAGAPNSKAAGVELLTPLNMGVEKGQPLYVVHSETKGELNYAIDFLKKEINIIKIEQS